MNTTQPTFVAQGACPVCGTRRGAAVPVCLVHWQALPRDLRQAWGLSEDPLERGLIARRIVVYLRKIGAR